MVHFPFVIFTKIGITGKSVRGRAAQIDEAVFGFPIPVMVIFIPFCYSVEQFLHTVFSPIQYSFYKGDGHTEWFLFPAGAAVVWMGWKYWAGVWMVYQWFLNTYL